MAIHGRQQYMYGDEYDDEYAHQMLGEDEDDGSDGDAQPQRMNN